MAAADRPLVRNIPNALTLARLAVVPLFIGLLYEHEGTTLAAGLLFTAAAFTDFVDGWFARRFGVMSQFGKVVDPLADRLLVNAAAIMLAIYDERVIGWEFVVVVLRDIVAIYGFYRLSHYVLPDVSVLGKWGMFLMMAGLAWLLMLPAALWPLWLFWIGLAISVIVMGHYVWRYRWALGSRPDVYSPAPPAAVEPASTPGEE